MELHDQAQATLNRSTIVRGVLRGEPRVCSMVPIPSEVDEEARRTHREREDLTGERRSIVNKIGGISATLVFKCRRLARTGNRPGETTRYCFRSRSERWRHRPDRRRRDRRARRRADAERGPASSRSNVSGASYCEPSGSPECEKPSSTYATDPIHQRYADRGVY
jgi:hypothetical protein